MRERLGEGDAGGQPAMRMLQLCAAECVFRVIKVCVRVYQEKEKDSITVARLCALTLSSWLSPLYPLFCSLTRVIHRCWQTKAANPLKGKRERTRARETE